MKNYNYETEDFVLPVGFQNDGFDTEQFMSGKIVAIGVYIQGDLPEEIINFTLKNSGGDKVFKGSTLKDWQPRQGAGYIESMKPVSIDSGKSFIFDFATKKALSSELIGQIVFVIDQGPSCNF